ncbi:MAG: orotidine-5'-phosphate decarboxylase [Clostridia bacterium]|nr:orotidine-5'-phosphate decarboxylase [Clostridia bacterium]
MDRLIQKIKETNNPTVIGVDTRYDMVPDCVKNKYSKDINGMCKAMLEYSKALIDATYDIIPAVKLQSAYFEMYGVEGIKLYKEMIDYCKEKDMVVMADVKRGDIGSTSAGYSKAYLGKNIINEKEQPVFDVDFATVNPYMGSDCVNPFVEDCKKYDKGIFVLVKTSNKSSGELQDLKTEDGEEIYKKVAKLVNQWGEDLVGKYGYSSVSAVVGATYPKQLKELRELMPKTYFLIPGYGAQGGKAEDIALGFDENGLGGIVNATRSLMCAYKSDLWKDKFAEEDYAKATRAEAIRMRDELNAALKK